MKDLLIFGNGVHACEMVEILERADTDHEYNFIGFIGRELHNNNMMGYPVYSISELDGRFRHVFLVPDNTFELELKQKYIGRMVTLIDPSCFVSKAAKIGPGTVLYPHCYVGRNAVLESFVFCLSGCIINHDDVIGTGSILASGVRIAGNVSVGQQAYLGQACTIRQLLKIGEKSLIGTGAVVVKDVAPGSVMVGNPAHILDKHKP